MASIAIMAGGAILNAAAFIGGNYLAKALGGGDAALDEKVRHDKALEAYQAAYAKYSRDRTKLLDWIATNTQIKEQAKQNFTNTDYAFKLYNQAHPDKQMIPPKEPKFSDFYQPSQQQIKGPLGCLVSVKKRLKYTLPNSYYKSKCFARPQKACMLFTLAIFTGSSLKTFAPLKK